MDCNGHRSSCLHGTTEILFPNILKCINIVIRSECCFTTELKPFALDLSQISITFSSVQTFQRSEALELFQNF